MNNTLRLYNFKDHLFVPPLLVYCRYLPQILQRGLVNTQYNFYLASNPLFKSFYSTENSKRTSPFYTLLDAAKMARCQTLMEISKLIECIETFGRDGQPVNCKILHYVHYPLKKNPSFSSNVCRRAKENVEKKDDCFMAKGIYRLTKILQERPQ